MRCPSPNRDRRLVQGDEGILFKLAFRHEQGGAWEQPVAGQGPCPANEMQREAVASWMTADPRFLKSAVGPIWDALARSFFVF